MQLDFKIVYLHDHTIISCLKMSESSTFVNVQLGSIGIK